jgi:tRNA(fMet)-specific endonuclease VapC
MYIVDPDHMSLMQRGGVVGQRIWQRIRAIPPDDIGTTVVSYEEQTRGWLARIAQAKTLDQQIIAYNELKRLLQDYCNIAVVDFEAKAAAEFERLKQMKLRMGTMDLKIAAIVLANNATLLTRNSSDFGKIPGLKIEDWSV